MTTDITQTTVQEEFTVVWGLIQSMPNEQRIQAESALKRAYNHVTGNIQALLAMADELRLQRDITINEIAFIRKHRGHVSYDDVARDMAMEIDGINYEEARRVVDVLCGMSDFAVTNWDVMGLREAIRLLTEDINENILLEAEYERDLAEQREFD